MYTIYNFEIFAQKKIYIPIWGADSREKMRGPCVCNYVKTGNQFRQRNMGIHHAGLVHNKKLRGKKIK